ncbi:MAG TPA: glycosyltransferase family 4 protein, partial [Povalibacter sp.]|nr:glycosyltransferase family 4 protein [Povalibacter sp.]
MKIWLVTVGEPLPRAGNSARLWRTGILARTLVDRGHDVTWWTSSVDHFTKRQMVEESSFERIQPGLALQFLHGRLYTRNISLARFLNHRDIAAEFIRLARDAPAPDIILCSYPTIELSDAAVTIGAGYGVPVLLDIRDLWPDELVARLPAFLRPAAPWLMFPLFRGARRALGNATGIVAISRTYLEWARKMGGRTPRECDLFAPMGYEPFSRAQPSAAAEERLRAVGVDPARKIVWFCGTFVGSIDLSTPIECARELVKESSLQFVFTGSGERDQEWRAAARGLDNVIFTGWADRDEIAHLARLAWIGLAAYKRGALMSLPNKIFEYMAAGLPVVSSLAGEAGALLTDNDAGLLYAAGDSADLGAKLLALAADPGRRERLA